VFPAAGFFRLAARETHTPGELNMVPRSLVLEIRRWLDEDELSLRQIAARTGLTRNTVAEIANGKIFQRPRRARQEAYGNPEDFPELSQPPRRCPDCGRLVYLPCRPCLIERRAAESDPPDAPADDGPMQLELRGACRRRYEEVLVNRLITSVHPEFQPPYLEPKVVGTLRVPDPHTECAVYRSLPLPQLPTPNS
jgi:transcriptional regulator with XRE-family HTH domain